MFRQRRFRSSQQLWLSYIAYPSPVSCMSSKKRKGQAKSHSLFSHRRTMTQRTLFSKGKIGGPVNTADCVCRTNPASCQVLCELPADGCRRCIKGSTYKKGHHHACAAATDTGRICWAGKPHCEYRKHLEDQKAASKVNQVTHPKLAKGEVRNPKHHKQAMREMLQKIQYDRFCAFCVYVRQCPCL